MRRTAAWTITFLCSSLPLLAQIEGRVINSATNDPVPNAEVSLACVKAINRSIRFCRSASTRTAEDGTFKFSNVSTFQYLISAQGVSGLVSTRASQFEFEMDYRHRPPSLLLKLEPESAISGMVTDFENHPHPGVDVVAWRQYAVASRSQLKPVAKAVSDDSGAYIFPHLIPGNYYVSTALVTTRQTSKLRNRPLEQYQLYAPSSLSLEEAISTHVDMGQTYSAVDLKLRPIITYFIQGRAQTETTGQNAYDKLELHLDMRDSQGVSAPGREIILDDDGRFQANVVPGSYILRLVGTTAVLNPKTPKAPPDTMLHLLARQDLEVTGKDILNITLLIPPPFLINGHVSLEGAPQAKPELGDVTLRPLDPEATAGNQTATVQPDGAFTITNCDASDYGVRYTPPPGTYISAMTFNGQDAMSHPLDLAAGSGGELKILLRSGPSSVSATIQDSTVSPDVVLIPDNWTPYGLIPVVYMTNNKDGRYTAAGLAPGHYSAVAVVGSERQFWDNSAFVHQMQSRGFQFDLAENDQKQISAPLISEDERHQIELQLGLYY